MTEENSESIPEEILVIKPGEATTHAKEFWNEHENNKDPNILRKYGLAFQDLYNRQQENPEPHIEKIPRSKIESLRSRLYHLKQVKYPEGTAQWYVINAEINDIRNILQKAQEPTAKRKLNDETIELKLRNIVNKDIPKSITINGKKYYISRAQLQYIKNEEEKSGGFLPLLPLILGGLAAAGSVAGGSAAIAQAVNKKKAEDKIAAEQLRHNKEMEALAKGKGLYLEPRGNGVKEAIKDFAKRSGLEEGGKRLLKNTLYNLADSVKLEPTGNGLFLSPR